MGFGFDELLWVACDEPSGTARVDAIDTASPTVLRRLRAGEQSLACSYEHDDVGAEFARALAAALNARVARRGADVPRVRNGVR